MAGQFPHQLLGDVHMSMGMSPENTTLKHELGASRNTSDESGNLQNDDFTESEEESTEGSEAVVMDDDLGCRVKAVLEGVDSPYDPLREATPNLPAYHPSFAKVERIYSEIVEDAINLLRLATYKDI